MLYLIYSYAKAIQSVFGIVRQIILEAAPFIHEYIILVQSLHINIVRFVIFQI